MITDDKNWYYWTDKAGQIFRSPMHHHDDVLRGMCSGIPFCCITFFITEWMMCPELSPEHDKNMQEAKSRGSSFRYIPCPKCLSIGNFVEVKSCDGPHCICGQWEHREVINEQLSITHKRWKRIQRMSRKRRRGYA